MEKFWRVKNLKPHPQSVEFRLPKVYKKFLNGLKLPATPVHYIPHENEFVLDPETKQKKRVENRPIPLKFPKEADEGIWGGEGVIHGFIKEKKYRRKHPKYWVPTLKKAVVYSEILNQYFDVTLTERTLRLIDQHSGFDHYILGSPVQDLKSHLALSIRRKMYLTILDRVKTHPVDTTNEEVFEKYDKYMISREEAEWFGLTKREAIQKQRLLEEEVEPVPLKHALRLKFIEELKNKADSKTEEEVVEDIAPKSWRDRLNLFPGIFDYFRIGPKSWLSKLNPFAGRKKEE